MLVLALRKSIDSLNCGAFEFLFLCALSRYIFPARSPAALSLAFYIFLPLFLQSWGVSVRTFRTWQLDRSQTNLAIRKSKF
jgi:hypothetical protein